MERRGFLRGILAAGMAPAISRAASLMPVRALESGILVPSNALVTSSIVAAELMRILMKNMHLANSINAGWDEAWTSPRIRIAQPKRYTMRGQT